MKLTNDQKRLAQLQFETNAKDIAASSQQELQDVKRMSFRWEPNDPRFFAACSEVYAKNSPALLWARAMTLFEVAERANLLGDDECYHDLLKEIRSTAKSLGDSAPKSSLGDPWGDFSLIIQRSLIESLKEIESEIERRHLAEAQQQIQLVDSKASKLWVMTLHGIKTRGTWQKDLVRTLNDAGFNSQPLDYGNFWALQLINPRSRAKKVEWFRDEYTRHVERTGSTPCIIVHSFGTYIVAHALKRYPEIQFQCVIFAGSIVARDFPCSRHIPFQLAVVLNDCGDRDIWSAIGPWMIKDVGQSGKSGFLDVAKGKVINRKRSSFGHSDHFYDLNFLKSWVSLPL